MPESKLSEERNARLVEVSRELNSQVDFEELLKLIISEAAALTESESASILLLDPRTRELRFKATSGEMPPEMADTPVPLNNSIAGYILTEDKAVITDDVSNDPRWNPQVSQKMQFATGSILGVPMHDAHKPVGVLEAINKIGGRFTEEDVETLSTLADLAGVAVEKARLISELKRLNQELSELDRLKSDFIALASHELRTPLSIILGYVTFLREDADHETGTQLDNVLSAAVRLRDIIQDMLNLKYVDAGGALRDLKQIDFADLLRQVLSEREEAALAKQQKITFNLPSQPLLVSADLDMLEVIFTNLLTNAIKFTLVGGEINVSVEIRENEAWLRVKDTGIGIPENELGRIFNRFYQVEPHLSRRYGGLGLGLAITKDLVELHNGRIWATSQINVGSEFVVALPLIETS